MGVWVEGDGGREPGGHGGQCALVLKGGEGEAAGQVG